MADLNLNDFYKIQMSDADFNRLSTFIYKEYGIKMPPAKKTMLQSRLLKRLRELNIPSYKDYIDFVFSKKGQMEELFHMIDEISTNKTDFFRESAHFDFLSQYLLPELYRANYRNLRVWSAASSSGEEPYTLAIVLSEFGALNSNFQFTITGSDISIKVLQKAVNGIYTEDRIEMIPMTLKRKYFLKSKDSEKKTIRVSQELRKKVNFMRVNLMDDVYSVPDNQDIIFCRNVLIYFDRETQEKVICKLCNKLRPGGFFFLGHSESITNMVVPLKQVKPTIFRKIG